MTGAADFIAARRPDEHIARHWVRGRAIQVSDHREALTVREANHIGQLKNVVGHRDGLKCDPLVQHQPAASEFDTLPLVSVENTLGRLAVVIDAVIGAVIVG